MKACMPNFNTMKLPQWLPQWFDQGHNVRLVSLACFKISQATLSRSLPKINTNPARGTEAKETI